MRRLMIFVVLVIVSWCCLSSLIPSIQTPAADLEVPQGQGELQSPAPQPPDDTQEDTLALAVNFTEKIKAALAALHDLMVGVVNDTDQAVPETQQWVCGGAWLVILVLIVAGAITLRVIAFIGQVLNL